MTGRKDDLYALDLSAAKWRKSPRSNGGEGCVEITDLPGGGIAVRDSVYPDRPPLRYTKEEWDYFRESLVSNEL